MKSVKNFVFAALLVSILTVNTPAGEQQTPGYAPPPPPRMTVSDESTPVISITDETGDILAETSDYLLLDALAAFLSVY
jgi:hypothetical protein